MPRLHNDELPIDVRLVRELVDKAFPEFAGDDLSQLRDRGSSNALYRLGGDKLVRLPNQPGGGTSILKESVWLPFIASRVSVRVPEVIGMGEPDFDLGYPERWAVTTWLPGAHPDARPNRLTDTRPLAEDLARFLTQLRDMSVPDDARRDESLSGYRGLPLKELDGDFREVVAECRDLKLELNLDDAIRVWDTAVEASMAVESIDIWYHGDLLSENLLLTNAGRLSAVIDFGSIAVGNPAVDLVVAWDALDDEGRCLFRQALDVDPNTWLISRGWALFLALITFPYYGSSMPLRCASRLAMAQAAVKGP